MTKKQMPKEIGNTLRKIRLRNRLSVRKLADLTGVDRTSMSEFERGLRTPTIENLLKILSYHEISMSRFFTEVEKVKKT